MRNTVLSWLLLGGVAACSPRAAHTSSAPTTTVAPVDPRAEPETAPTFEASRASAPHELMWVVSTLPNTDAASPVAGLEHRVELLVRSGATERRLAVGNATGGMTPGYQNICHAQMNVEDRVYPKAVDEHAKIAFMYGGADIFAVRKVGPEHYEVWHFADGHEACAKPPCALPGKWVTAFNLAAGKPIVESIRLVDSTGSERPYECSP